MTAAQPSLPHDEPSAEIRGLLVYNTKHISSYSSEMENIMIDLPKAVEAIKALILAQRQEAVREALNKVREQANGSYEVRTPKEPEYMVWEIAEWQLKDIEAEVQTYLEEKK